MLEYTSENKAQSAQQNRDRPEIFGAKGKNVRKNKSHAQAQKKDKKAEKKEEGPMDKSQGNVKDYGT